MTTKHKDWFILRCSGANTLRLAQSLAWADIEAWAPALTSKKRTPRRPSHRIERTAIMPRFVFVRCAHKAQIQAIREDPLSPHPKFWFLHDGEGHAEVADAALDSLRVAEEKGKPIEQARQWQTGERVRYPASGFEGLVGSVTRVRGKRVWVTFAGMPSDVEAPAFLLLPEVEREMARAA